MKAWAAGLGLAALAAGLGLALPAWWEGDAPATPPVPSAARPEGERGARVVTFTPLSVVSTPAPPGPLASAPSARSRFTPQRPPAPSELDRLVAAARQGDVRASHAAYRALAACVPPAGAPCPGVPASLVQERLRFLAEAVQAGLPQAQVDFYMEGPSPLQALDEPALQAWRAQALTGLQAAAAQCDPFAAGLLATLQDSGELAPRSSTLAVAYAVAEGEWRRRPPSDAALRDRLAEPISDAALAAARQQGLRLAAACR
ncbi:hypothetical protein [Roseateles sp. BYS87W]|uniref:Uncharacterized protein n=1 Tax=Pelomonas baiyunensis TaxID=3299026 RepID=A0ABW7H077_9BURK